MSYSQQAVTYIFNHLQIILCIYLRRAKTLNATWLESYVALEANV